MTLTENQVRLLNELEQNFKSMNGNRLDEFYHLDEIFEKSDEKRKLVNEIKAFNKAFKESAIENFQKEVTYVANLIKNRYESFKYLSIEFGRCNTATCYFHNRTTSILDAFMKIEIEFKREEEKITYNRSFYSRVTKVYYRLNGKTTNSYVFDYLDELFKSEIFKEILQSEYEKRA